MIFKRKVKELPKREIEFHVNVVGAEALHIKRTGTYILEVDTLMNRESVNDILKTLRQQTGAKWILMQGGAKVRKCSCHG